MRDRGRDGDRGRDPRPRARPSARPRLTGRRRVRQPGLGVEADPRHPDRVTRLILADALYPLEDAEIALPFRAMATPILGPLALALVGDPSPPGASAGYHGRLRPTYGIAGTRAAWLDYVQSPTRRDDLAAALPTIAATTLVLHGTDDPFVPHAAMARAAPHIPRVRIVDLEGGGHFPHRDDPDRFVAELDTFLAEP